MAEPRRDIGQFIREQRNLAELSVRRLADMAGVSNPYLSQIERGLRKPSADILLQLAQALHVSAETMYIQAGMLDPDAEPPTADLETAIRSARELTEDQRKALLSVYRSFLATADATANDAHTADAADAEGAADAADAEDGGGDATADDAEARTAEAADADTAGGVDTAAEARTAEAADDGDAGGAPQHGAGAGVRPGRGSAK